MKKMDDFKGGTMIQDIYAGAKPNPSYTQSVQNAFCVTTAACSIAQFCSPLFFLGGIL
jgi:hypothetical protein